MLAAWAATEPAVSGLVLIGSRQRGAGDAVWRADAQSDWDFQIITSRPGTFERPEWTRGLGGIRDPGLCAPRSARIGGVPKVNLLYEGGEADFVVIPAKVIRRVRFLTGLAGPPSQRAGPARRQLQDLAVVIRPGWRFLKDTGQWDRFYRRAVAEVPDPRVGDELARQLAEGFVCDYVWTIRKIDRGELRAAQRMAHRELAETNFRLLHELKLRRGERTFPEARRLERIAGAAELAARGRAMPGSRPRGPASRRSSRAPPPAASSWPPSWAGPGAGPCRGRYGRAAAATPGGRIGEQLRDHVLQRDVLDRDVRDGGRRSRISWETAAAMSVVGTRSRNLPSSPRAVLP